MAQVIKSFDVSDVPELLALAEDVRLSDEPCLLRHGERPVAILAPLDFAADLGVPLPKTEADHDAFHAAAGAWKDIEDVDEMVRYIKRLRGRADESLDEG